MSFAIWYTCQKADQQATNGGNKNGKWTVP